MEDGREAAFLRALWEVIKDHPLECKCDKCKVWLKYFRFEDGRWIRRQVHKGNKGDFSVPLFETRE